MRLQIVAVALMSLCSAMASAQGRNTVSFESLLREAASRGRLAQWPVRTYTCRQFSSYDRASVSPDDPETWFANGDAGNFLRVEEHDGRTEYVMMDAEGPGAVVRIWSANPTGTIRIYLDERAAPAIECPMADLLGGKAQIGGAAIEPPLSAVRGRGWNLYLPIPYARRCKITSDEGGFYYQVNYRTYEPGTSVNTMKTSYLSRRVRNLLQATQQSLQDSVRQAQKQWNLPAAPMTRRETLQPGMQIEETLRTGQNVITTMAIKLEAAEMDKALRQTVLRMEFDGDETVWCPVGDLFGVRAGVEQFGDFFRVANGSRVLVSSWEMPYESSARVTLENLGQQSVDCSLYTVTQPRPWTKRSMHFHTTWRQESPLHTRPFRDWNYVTITGQGVYAGDSLSVVNPVPEWWGEGDEKIYVDGESFPSHFGTGTEDYYGYAWCCNEPFDAPFHAQPRCNGFELGNNWGHTTVGRVRTLDAIPFESGIRVDMEVWHWKECDVTYAATAYFYAKPGATTNCPPMPDEVRRGVIDPPPLPPPFQIDGAIECEAMEIVSTSPDLPAGAQAMSGFARETWSGDAHLWVQGRAVGDFVELRVPVDEPGRYRLTLYATKSWDYGVVQFSIGGQPAGETIDLFSGQSKLVVATGPIDLGAHDVTDGSLLLRAEVVGGHEQSLGTRSFFGLDCIVLERVAD